jgi:hypothetical protein
MFRVKTRRIKRPVSPPPELPASPLVAPVVPIQPPPSVIAPVSDMSGAEAVIPEQKAPTTLMGRLTNFFEAESAAVSITKPWLRLERGLRLQKLRTFAENYPGLSDEDKETLNKTLVKANDAKLLNTKQQIVYEGGKIMAIRGLKVTKTGDPLQPASFKIEIPRQTKKKNND